MDPDLMINIGESAAGNKALETLLKRPHTMRVVVRLLTLDHVYLDDISEHFYEGQVSIDASADTSTRVLDLTLMDVQGKLSLDPDSPSKTSIYIATMVQVIVAIGNPEGTKSYSIPVFTGPVDDVDRDGFFLKVKALGKEVIGLGNTWQAKTYKKGLKKTDVIKDMLIHRMGETKFSIPDYKGKMPNDLKLKTDKSPWQEAVRLARSMGCQLFYDGRGVATLRKKPVNTSLVIDDSIAINRPQTAYDISSVINAVKVIGGKPKKAKKKVQYSVVAKTTHPLSPWRLGRGSAPRYLWTQIEDDNIRSKKEAKAVAHRELRRGLIGGVDLAIDGLPMFRLEEGDLVRVDVDDTKITLPLSRFTIPLTADGTSSYGYLKNLKPKGRQPGIKRKKKRKKK